MTPIQRGVFAMAITHTLAGCEMDSTLAELGPAQLDSYFDGVVPGALHVSLLVTDCPTIHTEAAATIDGIAMSLAYRGGIESYSDEDGGGDFCIPIRFSLAADKLPRGATSTIVIADSTATMTVEVDGLIATDITMTGTPTTNAEVVLHWPSSGPEIWNPFASFRDHTGTIITSWYCDMASPATCTPRAYPYIPTFKLVPNHDWIFPITWNSDQPPPGPTSGILTVAGRRTNVTTVRRCDGPTSCRFELESLSSYPATLF